MKVAILLLVALLAFAHAEDKSDHWAVLVAGSNGFWNYRHQADICHAYHIMLDHGIPADQIITLAYDDIASSSSNPFPGKIFNQPNGKDVYEGCVIDYKGKEVTPANFLAVLKGTAKGKSLKSNANSKVFINFSDHGAPGLIAFPVGELYAKDFHEALLYMHTNQMYKEMTVYIEACESGSMFDGILENNLNIYATTAANPSESSWGYYCSPDDVVNGKHIGSCLGDLYSIAWMEDSDAEDLCSESLDTQFTTVLTRTDKSHVMKYGDMSFTSEVVGNFQGTCDAQAKLSRFLKTVQPKQSPRQYAAIDSRDAKMDYLYNKYMRTKSIEDGAELQNEIEYRGIVDHRFAQLRSKLGIELEEHPFIQDFDCYESLVEFYKSQCDGLNEYDLKYLGTFVNMCNAKMTPATMLGLMNKMC